ncbi:hypothetical protein [Victivallis sp. Marseille-Q1083]|uniref:hypothetical protein n=1 Tax=Victivallis sp. Marseille-Q1083 TaxID=2717288 RepID=UPI00158DFDB5|nr:hypothetical protein [Victivallis sp. Marseille-Q1083]
MVTDSYSYNEKNQLARIARTGQPTVILGYDALGNRTQTGWNGDGDGLLTAASSDRIVIDETGYLKENGNWFLH